MHFSKKIFGAIVALALVGVALLNGAATPANAVVKESGRTWTAPLASAPVSGVTFTATPANDGTFGQTKYVYFDSNHRFGAYAQMSFDTVATQGRVTRGYYVSAWTEVKQSDGSWARVRLCAGQDLVFRYSVRKSDGNHPSPMDWFNTDANVAYGNFSIPPVKSTWWDMTYYTVSLHAGYIGEGSCLYPYNVDKDASFYAHQY